MISLTRPIRRKCRRSRKRPCRLRPLRRRQPRRRRLRRHKGREQAALPPISLTVEPVVVGAGCACGPIEVTTLFNFLYVARRRIEFLESPISQGRNCVRSQTYGFFLTASFLDRCREDGLIACMGLMIGLHKRFEMTTAGGCDLVVNAHLPFSTIRGVGSDVSSIQHAI